jgi:peptidyl-prolyl cis-trans isomerase B (cyclophilin B)
LSPDQNRQRPRSSKKQRALQRGAASTAGANRPIRPTTQRPNRGAPRGGSAAGGIPTAWLAVIAVVVFAVGVALASGAIKFGAGGAGASPSGDASGNGSGGPARSGGASAAASGGTAGGSPSVGPRGSGCPTSQPPAAPAGQSRIVTIETAKGRIEITLKADLSPIAVGNFAALAGCGFYNGVVFHRVATLDDGTPFVIQGGDPTGTGGGGPGYSIQDEPVTAKYVRGTVAMARSSAPNSVGSQFFIVLDDKDQSVLAAYNTYQIIGSVTSGMETVDAIYQAAGGQETPASPVAMDKVTIGNP